jgi:hypothetical protein
MRRIPERGRVVKELKTLIFSATFSRFQTSHSDFYARDALISRSSES